MPGEHFVEIGGGSSASYPVVTWTYITFGDGGQEQVNCEEMIKVSKFVTFKCVALVKPLGLFCS
jgi:hypothetical protein